MTREELELHQQHLAITEELVAAKQAYRDKPTDKNRERVAAAKVAAREFTVFWRGIRDAFAPDSGAAKPSTVRASARS